MFKNAFQWSSSEAQTDLFCQLSKFSAKTWFYYSCHKMQYFHRFLQRNATCNVEDENLWIGETCPSAASSVWNWTVTNAGNSSASYLVDKALPKVRVLFHFLPNNQRFPFRLIILAILLSLIEKYVHVTGERWFNKIGQMIRQTQSDRWPLYMPHVCLIQMIYTYTHERKKRVFILCIWICFLIASEKRSIPIPM